VRWLDKNDLANCLSVGALGNLCDYKKVKNIKPLILAARINLRQFPHSVSEASNIRLYLSSDADADDPKARALRMILFMGTR
jgi:hypothetical protein